MLRISQTFSTLLATALVLSQLAEAAPLRCDPNACISRLSNNYFDIACSAGQCFGCRWVQGGLHTSSEDDFVACNVVEESLDLVQEASSRSTGQSSTIYEPVPVAKSESEASDVDAVEQSQTEDLDKRIEELVQELSRPLLLTDSTIAEDLSHSSSSSGSFSDTEDMPAWLHELFLSVDDPGLQQALSDEVQELFIDGKRRDWSKP